MSSPADGFTRVIEVLDRLKIPYFVGGSLASSVHGKSRPTMDADIVADIQAEQTDEPASCCNPISTRTLS